MTDTEPYVSRDELGQERVAKLSEKLGFFVRCVYAQIKGSDRVAKKGKNLGRWQREPLRLKVGLREERLR